MRYGNPNLNTIPRALPYDALNCRVPLENDQTSIVCTMAPGVGSGHHWRVTLGGDVGARRRTRRSLQTFVGVTSTTFAANTKYRPPVRCINLSIFFVLFSFPFFTIIVHVCLVTCYVCVLTVIERMKKKKKKKKKILYLK